MGIAAEDVYAGINPAGKAALVEQLKQQGRRVAMVGDGINDTAALAAADVGMAMAGGVEAASDVAKIVLMGDQLHQVGQQDRHHCNTVLGHDPIANHPMLLLVLLSPKGQLPCVHPFVSLRSAAVELC